MTFAAAAFTGLNGYCLVEREFIMWSNSTRLKALSTRSLESPPSDGLAHALWVGLTQPSAGAGKEIDSYLSSVDNYITSLSRVSLPHEVLREIRRYVEVDVAVFESFYSRLSSSGKRAFIAHCAKTLGFSGRPSSCPWDIYLASLKTLPPIPTKDHIFMAALKRTAPVDFLLYLYPNVLNYSDRPLWLNVDPEKSAVRVAKTLRTHLSQPTDLYSWTWYPDQCELRIFNREHIREAVAAYRAYSPAPVSPHGARTISLPNHKNTVSDRLAWDLASCSYVALKYGADRYFGDCFVHVNLGIQHGLRSVRDLDRSAFSPSGLDEG
jgi:hypothetical protein